MPKKEYDLEYKGSVTPTATTFLKPQPFTMDFSAKIELDETDGANLANLQKAFKSEMDSQIKNSLSNLNKWLKEKDQLVSDLVKKHDALKKSIPFPSTPQQATAYTQQMKALEPLATEIKTLEADFTQIVGDWATNAREQQGRVCMVTAVKKARIKTYNDKVWRVRLGQALKVVLAVTAIALAIAATVLTAGSTAPIFVGLASAGLAISGISSIAGLGKMFTENATIEKKLMANVSKDIETVKTALKPLDTSKSNIAKHVTELKNLMNIRKDNIGKYKTEIQKYQASAKGYTDALAQLKSKQAADAAEIAKREKGITSLNTSLKEAQGKIAKLEQDNAAAQKLLDELVALNVDLDKISGQSANSIAGNLKARFTSLDGWLDLGNNVGSVVSAASSVHS